MRRQGNDGGVADAWRMLARTFLLQQRFDDAIACCRTSQSIAERSQDELRTGGARYVLADCYEAMGRFEEARNCSSGLWRWTAYLLPKLGENTKRLEGLRQRLSTEKQRLPLVRVSRMNDMKSPRWTEARCTLSEGLSAALQYRNQPPSLSISAKTAGCSRSRRKASCSVSMASRWTM